jgi:RNA recognition motif-containing protein
VGCVCGCECGTPYSNSSTNSYSIASFLLQGTSSFFFNNKGGKGGKGGKGSRRPANFQSQRGDATAAQDASHAQHKVFVGGISFNIDANGLWDAFSAAGEFYWSVR